MGKGHNGPLNALLRQTMATVATQRHYKCGRLTLSTTRQDFEDLQSKTSSQRECGWHLVAPGVWWKLRGRRAGVVIGHSQTQKHLRLKAQASWPALSVRMGCSVLLDIVLFFGTRVAHSSFSYSFTHLEIWSPRLIPSMTVSKL